MKFGAKKDTSRCHATVTTNVALPLKLAILVFKRHADAVHHPKASFYPIIILKSMLIVSVYVVPFMHFTTGCHDIHVPANSKNAVSLPFLRFKHVWVLFTVFLSHRFICFLF